MLQYQETGHGPGLLLLHGFAVSSAIWNRQVGALSARYRVVVPDLPGHGRTPAPAVEMLTIEQLAADALALMDSLQAETFAVAGHSMGGYVALALQKMAPHRVAGVGLVTTQARADTPEGQAGRRTLAARVQQEGAGTLADALCPKLFGPNVPPGSEEYITADAFIRQMPVGAISACLLGMAEREDARKRLPAIKVPALVIGADEDKVIPAERSDEMAALLPDAALVRVPGVGHMVSVEAPEAVTDALSRWLDRVYPARKGT